MGHPFFALPHPIVIGHRGAAGERPENTLASFEAALAAGAGVLESDVQLTRDGVPILLHDPTLERIGGGSRAAAELDWDELARLDAGLAYQAADGSRPWAGRGLRVARLEEAFACFPDARFNLELKCGGARIVTETLRLVARARRDARTLLTAGEDPLMAELRRGVAASGLRPALGASLADVLAVIGSALADKPMPPDVMALQIPPEFAGKPLVTPALVDHAHAHGLEVHVWTLNEPAEFDAQLALGIDGIVTDFPARLAGHLAARSPVGR